MRLAVWVGLGWLGLVVASALATRMPWAHLVPDVPLLVVAYLAMRVGARQAACVAAVLGCAVDNLASSPLGLHPTALVATALLVWLVSGHLGGTGAVHFGLVNAFSQLSYHLALVLLLWWQNFELGFVSWPAALLLPAAALAFVLAWLTYRPLEALHRRLAPNARAGLRWQ